jgi:hypothetical protein
MEHPEAYDLEKMELSLMHIGSVLSDAVGYAHSKGEAVPAMLQADLDGLRDTIFYIRREIAIRNLKDDICKALAESTDELHSSGEA